MKRSLTLLLFLFVHSVWILATPATQDAVKTQTRSDEAIQIPVQGFIKPPLKYYQEKFLILSTFVLENTSNKHLTVSISGKGSGNGNRWEYLKTIELGPYEEYKEGGNLSIGIGNGEIEFSAKGYLLSLRARVRGGDLVETWFE